MDALLGPEMRSTGEVMGHAAHFGHAFAKAEIAAGTALPLAGTVLLSVNDFDKSAALKLARDLGRMGFRLLRHGGHGGLHPPGRAGRWRRSTRSAKAARTWWT